MKLWFIEIGEPLPIEENARLLRYGLFTRALANTYGHEVTWWTSGFSHFKKEQIVREDTTRVVDNVILKIIKGPGYQKSISIRRMRHHRDFAGKFSRMSVKAEKPDLIICGVPTIENAFEAVKIGLQRKCPVLIDIRDEWPDEWVDMAPSFLRPVVRLVLNDYYQKMTYICKHATGLIAMSNRQHAYGLNFAGRPAFSSDGVFPHGYPMIETGTIRPQEEEWFLDMGIDPDQFTCCFFGTIGNYFNLDTVIQSADQLCGQLPIQFVICGHGSRMDEYRQKSLHNRAVFFPGFVDALKIKALMGISDIGLAPYAAGTKMSLPNKVFEYMAGGLPIISSIQGEITQILDEYACGLTYHPDSVEELVDAIRKLYDAPELKNQMGRNAREIFLQKYTTGKIIDRLNTHILQVVDAYQKG